MDYEWTGEEKAARDRVGALLDGEGVPSPEGLDRAELAGIEEATRSLLGRLASAGYLHLCRGESWRADVVTLLAAGEPLARTLPSMLLAVESSSRLFGTVASMAPGLDEEVLVPLDEGKVVGGLALSEPPGEGSRARCATTAERTGGGVVLQGSKSFVTNGPFADWLLVVVTMDDLPTGVLLRRDWKGLRVGPRIETLGMRGMAACAVELEGVVVPERYLIEDLEGRGALTALVCLEHLMLAIASLGLMEGSLAAARLHAHAHERAGRAVVGHQEVSFLLAEMHTLADTARLMIRRAAWLLATADAEAETVLACAKVFASEAAESVASAAMQVAAGQGYVAGSAAERAYRDARYPALAGTTSERARMGIAEALLETHRI